VPHRAAPLHSAELPVRITLRSHLRTLATPRVAAVVSRAIDASGSLAPSEFRVVCYGIDDDRVRLVVEARSARSLSFGVRSLTIRIARTVNAHLSREGRLWADRWHGRDLASAKEVRDLAREMVATRVHANGAQAARTRLGRLARLRASRRRA